MAEFFISGVISPVELDRRNRDAPAIDGVEVAADFGNGKAALKIEPAIGSSARICARGHFEQRALAPPLARNREAFDRFGRARGKIDIEGGMFGDAFLDQAPDQKGA